MYRDEEMELIELVEIQLNAIDSCRIGKDGVPGGKQYHWFDGTFRRVEWNHELGRYIPIMGG